MLTLICPICNKSFEREETHYKSNIKRGRSNCCSIKCATQTAINKNGYHHSIKLNCKQCDVVFTKKYSEYIKSKNNFCSRSCAATYNGYIRNIGKEKNFKEKILKPYIPVNSKTFYAANYTKEFVFSNSKNWQSARTTIRKHACMVFKESNQERKCVICGYDKTIQVAHIKSVSSFSNDSLVSEINDISNIIALCPNHHWEFDHGLVKLNN